MDDALRAIPGLVVVFGPVGAVLFILVLVMGYFYRRDFKRDLQKSEADLVQTKAAHAKRDEREERMIGVIERNAAASERLSLSIEHQGRLLRDGLERQSQQIAEIIRELRSS